MIWGLTVPFGVTAVWSLVPVLGLSVVWVLASGRGSASADLCLWESFPLFFNVPIHA